MTARIVTRRSVAEDVAALLDSPEVAALVEELDGLRWTGQKGYGARALVGACLVKSLYLIPTWSRTARLIAEHRALADVLGGTPSQWACYRFCRKLRENAGALAECLDRVTAALREELPEYGREVAIDASDLPAYANGQRFLSKNGPERERYSDLDASWGHRSAISTRKGGGFYGYKIHAAICARTDLPLAWTVKTARTHESAVAADVLAAVHERGFRPDAAILDKGYDVGPVYDVCEAHDCRPIIPLRKVPNALPAGAPVCEHGVWTFAGAHYDRKTTSWRCPTGECEPKSRRIDASRRNPLVPRETKRWGDLFRKRGCVERGFGRLKHEYGLKPLRTRGLARVALHADLTVLACLGTALIRARARAVPLAA